MKKRIIAVICATMLVLGSSMTAFAAPSPEAGVITPSPEAPVIPDEDVPTSPSPEAGVITPSPEATTPSTSTNTTSSTTPATSATTAETLIAPRLDLLISSEDLAIAPLAVSKDAVKIGDVPVIFKDLVLEALQICIGDDIRVLNVLDCKNLINAAEGTPIALSAPGVTPADNVIILAYNDELGVWQFLPVATLYNEIYTVLGGHSKLAIIVDGVLAESLRFVDFN